MKLYLMRHGEAAHPGNDPEQGLTESGQSKIESLAKHLAKQGLKFGHIYHSDKKRARQTAEIMQRVIAPDLTARLHHNLNPNDDPGLLLAEINNWSDDTLITSHLPFVPNLITLLTGQDAYLTGISFETGTIVCLEKINAPNWSIKWASSPGEI